MLGPEGDETNGAAPRIGARISAAEQDLEPEIERRSTHCRNGKPS